MIYYKSIFHISKYFNNFSHDIECNSVFVAIALKRITLKARNIL